MIGPLPPPSGGVSIHIKRLSRLIENDFNVDYIDESGIIKNNYFNLRTYRLYQYLKRVSRSDMMYINSGTRLLIIFHLVTGKLFRKKIVLAIHGYRFKKKSLSSYLDSVFYSLGDRIIVVNSYILDRISLPADKCIVKDAFIPPYMEDEPDLPVHLINWLIRRKGLGEKIICANAYQLRIFNNQDLYGLDMCIEVVDSLIKEGVPLSFVFNVSSLEKGRDLYAKYNRIIKERNLTGNFLLLNEKLSFVKLITYSDIVLRPTNTDGDALTVREAIYLEKPVIASDVVPRPPHTILFRSRDIIDLKHKLKDTMDFASKVPSPDITGQNKEYKAFYTQLISTVLTGNR